MATASPWRIPLSTRRLLPPIVAMILFVPACNQQLADFEGIQLGKPLQGGMHATTMPSCDPNVLVLHREQGAWPFPAVLAHKRLIVQTDANGLVVAKLYADAAMAHWLLAQTSLVRWIQEVKIPEGFFHEPPGPEAADFFQRIAQMEAAARVLSQGMPESSRRSTRSGSRDGKHLACRVEMPVDPNRCKTDMRDYRGAYASMGRIDLGEQLDLTGVDVQALRDTADYFVLTRSQKGLFLSGVCTHRQEVPTVLDYLDPTVRRSRRLLDSIEGYGNTSMYYGYIFFYLAMITGGHSNCGRCPSDFWLDLRGITQDGFDATMDDGRGNRVRFRNMGDRRIRIEYTFSWTMRTLLPGFE